MNKLSLAEAVKLKNVLSKRIHELEVEMNRVAFIDVEKGNPLPVQTRSLIDVEKEIDSVRDDFRLLDVLMYRANISNTVTVNDAEVTIVEAIELATQLRAKAKKYKEFGSAQKEENLYPYHEGVSVFKVATFEPEDYRIKGIEFERQANRLSNSINAKNYTIELDFDSEKYF